MRGFPILTIGLVVRNEKDQILDCLNNIFETTAGYIIEIILVDNNSIDTTVSLVENWEHSNSKRNSNIKSNLNLSIIKLSSNNMALARNVILYNSKTEWVYFTDADCRLISESWKFLLSKISSPFFIKNENSIAAIGGGSLNKASSSFVGFGISRLSENWMGHLNSIQIKAEVKSGNVKLLSTFNMLLNSKIALRVGGFDEAYCRVGEDLSICYRLTKNNYSLQAYSELKVLHLQDSDLIHWIKKMFFYGKAQVHIAIKYPVHFLGFRGLNFILILVMIFMLFNFIFAFLTIFLVYIGSLFVFSKKNISSSVEKMLKETVFIFITHLSYASGELFALFSMPFFIFKILPKTNPVREVR